MEVFVRHLKILWTSERMLGELKLKLLTHKVLLAAAAALSGLFALGMLNLSAYLALQPMFSPAVSALLVAVGNLVITGLLLTIAQKLSTGSEAKLIGEVRDMALADIETEAQMVQSELRLVRDEIVGLRTSVSQIIKNPLEALAPKAILPLIVTITQILKNWDGASNKSSSGPAKKPTRKTTARKKQTPKARASRT